MTVRLGQAIGVFVVLVIAVDLSAQQGAPETGEWPTYSGDLGGTKYSPLDQIDADNFGTLEIAWHWQSADAVLSVEMPGRGAWRTNSSLIFDELNRRDPDRWRDGLPPTVTNLKATPLMVGGRLFINMPTSVGAAIDARTGKTLWVYNPKSYEAPTRSKATGNCRWRSKQQASDIEPRRFYWVRMSGPGQ